MFTTKRAFDLLFAAGGLLFLSPVLGLLAVAVKLSDGGPVFYRQHRVGQGGRLFVILKFRSMVLNTEKRITPVGRFLRKSKLDELPQLWNVLRGDMSFVGPRPEVPRYVAHYTAEQRQVLMLKPGITDLATLAFRNEEELLRTAADTEKFYMEYCVPRKIELNLAYARQANVWKDIKIIVRTLLPLKVGVETAESQVHENVRKSDLPTGSKKS